MSGSSFSTSMIRGAISTPLLGADQARRVDALLGVVHREIGFAAEEPELADALGRDPAGGEVGDQPARKLDPGVALVDLVGEHRHTDGADLGRRLAGHRQGDLEVVDHQVEDDIDIDGAGGEGRQPLGLEIADALGEAEGRLDGGVVELDVADGQHEVALVGHGDELGGLLEGGGDRLSPP